MRGCLPALMMIGALLFVVYLYDKGSPPSCENNWRLCSDNADMARNYDQWTDAEARCKIKAEQSARYGTPVWPWLAFGMFLAGNDYKSGHVTLIEPDAQFQNMFGALVHSTVTCHYDMEKESVTRIDITPN